MSGSLSAQSGPGSIVAAQMAIEDCLAGACKGMKIDLLSADHQNKPDVAVGIVRKWIDVDGVNAVTDIIQAAVPARRSGRDGRENRIALFPGGTAGLANEACAPPHRCSGCGTPMARPSASPARSPSPAASGS